MAEDQATPEAIALAQAMRGAEGADTLVQALLLAVRGLRSHAPDTGRSGSYTLSARLNEDGSWHWKWQWWPPTNREGGGAGRRVDDG